MPANFYEVKPYTSELTEDWKSVLLMATNATLMHDRAFLDYHPSGKFQDCSVIVYKDNAPVAVFSAHRKGKLVYSHKGLSYAGLIHKPSSFNQKLNCYQYLLKYYDSLGINTLQIKETPSIYDFNPNESTAYIMHLAQGEIIQMELSLAIKLPLRVTNKGRKANIKQANLAKLEIIESKNPNIFWEELLLPNLENRYGKQPTHCKEEMAFLMGKFPQNIRQFNVYKDDQVLAGATVYLTPNCLHTQYLASNRQGREQHALDALIQYLCENFAGKRQFLDFGHSNENQGLNINRFLFKWKESFGANSIVHNHFQVPVSGWKRLEDVYNYTS